MLIKWKNILFNLEVYGAITYIESLGYKKLAICQSSFASCTIENNELGKINSAILKKFLDLKPIIERELFTLSETLKILWQISLEKKLNNLSQVS